MYSHKKANFFFSSVFSLFQRLRTAGGSEGRALPFLSCMALPSLAYAAFRASERFWACFLQQRFVELITRGFF